MDEVVKTKNKKNCIPILFEKDVISKSRTVILFTFKAILVYDNVSKEIRSGSRGGLGEL